MATKKVTKPAGSDIVVTLTVELIGVGIMALLAGVNKGLGSVVVVVMVGFLFVWVLINTTDLQKWIGKA
jgi:hypothetical protein